MNEDFPNLVSFPYSTQPTSSFTPEGLQWLERPCQPVSGNGHVFTIAKLLCEPFALNDAEALLAIVAALSLVVGPGFLLRDAFGNLIPVSLQLLVRSGSHPGFDKAVSYLCQSVMDSMALHLGRGTAEHSKALIADQIKLEQQLNRVQAKLDAHDPIRQDGYEFHRNHHEETPEYLLPERERLIARRLKLRRQLQIFPIGDILEVKKLEALMNENQDVAFASYSPHGDALDYLFSGKPFNRLLNFINAGSAGNTIEGSSGQVVYPVVSLLWMVPSSLHRKFYAEKLHEKLPGVLSFVPSSSIANSSMEPKPPDEKLQQYWKYMVEAFASNLRIPLHDRKSREQYNLVAAATADAQPLIWATTSYATKFAKTDGYARSLLSKAPEQILKIAALLNLSTGAPYLFPISIDMVTAACEIYRLLIKCSLETAAGAETLPEALEFLKGKLDLHGPMTIRELTRKYHHQDTAAIRRTVSLGLAHGVITHNDGKYSLSTDANTTNCSL